MKISTHSLALLWLALSGSFVANAANFQDFKCHLTASQGPLIKFYRWQHDAVADNQRRLVGTRLTDLRGNPNFVKQVHECVAIGKSFSSPQGRKLDKQTLR